LNHCLSDSIFNHYLSDSILEQSKPLSDIIRKPGVSIENLDLDVVKECVSTVEKSRSRSSQTLFIDRYSNGDLGQVLVRPAVGDDQGV
jgi:hypothetical protein